MKNANVGSRTINFFDRSTIPFRDRITSEKVVFVILILMYIGGYEKMVVVGGGHYNYGVWQMIKVYVMNTHCTCEMPKSEADWNCVKVGEWDFESGREIDDGQT
jgi:hypothetical protein